ncbi:MAG: beta-propeller fold lactonase family protein [Proteobacteria bacterium]|nr:beta-propeller fold lactonase family protein [Pseudomonadota bacterium]
MFNRKNLFLFLFVLLTFANSPFLSAGETSEKSELKRKVAAPKLVRVPIGTAAADKGGRVSLELVARFQQYNPKPKQASDHYDRHIYSPKSVFFSGSTEKVFVNSLEGMSTVIYDRRNLVKTGVISHRFKRADARLFDGDENPGGWLDFPEDYQQDRKNNFWGKPVEFAETHNGRYLWVPYYRRSFDKNGALPSAVAVIDTSRDEIVRVMSTGPVPKMLAPSPDGKWLAVIHWGDNTVGLIDIGSEKPSEFHRAGIITVEKKYSLKSDKKVNRDSACGFCLRGAVFTRDSKYLLVGRMKGGGIAVIDVKKESYVDTVYGMKPTPRHLVLSAEGDLLYLSSNYSGYVSSYRVDKLINAALSGKGRLRPQQEVMTGRGTRTISLSPDGRLIYAAVKGESRIKVIDSGSMKVMLEIPTDSFPVGMAVSPDGTQLWVTAQGSKGVGGNSVSVYKVRRELLASK